MPPPWRWLPPLKLRLTLQTQSPPHSPPSSPPPPPQWLSSSEEKEDKEEDRLHNYDQEKYNAVVLLINEEPTSFRDLARRVVLEAHRSKEPLNLIGNSVLHEVIARGKTDLAVAIIDILGDFNVRIIRRQNYYGNTPLHIAAWKGDRRVAMALLKKDKTLALKRNRKGETPLHKAVEFGHFDVFCSIIRCVGDLSMAYDRTDDGSTILHYAIKRGQTKEALDIAEEFPGLILTRNAAGASPLQMMAVYFRKPPKIGILNSLLYKYIPLGKGTSLEERTIDEGSSIPNGSMSPDRGNCRSRLPGKCWIVQVISNLPKRIVKAREEISNYDTSMKLLKFIVEAEGFEFYIMGFKRSAGGRGIHIGPPLFDRTNSGAAEEDTDPLGEVPEVNDGITWEESPLITGVKLGLDDFVIKILRVRPVLATYLNYDGTNVLQAAVKYGRRRVVKAIKADKNLPLWLVTDLESDTDNTLLHIAASNTLCEEEGPLRLQDELEWFEMVEKIVPENLWDYRNRRRMTAREVFDENHKGMLKVCRAELAEIGRTCSPLVAAVVFTSSFYIPGEHNRESNPLAFKIFSHVYVVGFSCSATSLVMFLMLAVTPFKQPDFRRKVPWYFLMACFLLAMSLTAFIVAFACNMYLQIYGRQRKFDDNLATLLLELLLVPFLCGLALFLTGASWTFDILKRLIK